MKRCASPLAGALLAIAAAGANCEARAADALPQQGCYQRVYSGPHMEAHKGQFIVKAELEIKPPEPEQGHGIVANAALQVWVKGKKASFETLGACDVQGGALDCGASVSAAEVDQCKSSVPGVHDCRVDLGDAGSFRIEVRSGGVVVSVPKRMEMGQTGSDSGPYLNLVGSDKENSDFLLERAPEPCD